MWYNVDIEGDSMGKYDNEVCRQARQFKRKYPFTVTWRLKRHARIVNIHMNPDEKILYVFTAQKNDNPFDLFSSCVVVLTNRRLLIGRKRLFFGYFLDAITPDMFNDLSVISCVLWGKIHIDTVKEFVTLSNISKRALPEIETQVTTYMMHEKKRMGFNK